MTNSSLNPILFGIVVALASVLAVTTISSRSAIATGYGGGFVPDGEADVGVAEVAEAENATMMTNQTTTNGNTPDVQFLSIQSAQSGSLAQINATSSTLELSNVSDSTILFSDRPERTVETVSTFDFVGL